MPRKEFRNDSILWFIVVIFAKQTGFPVHSVCVCVYVCMLYTRKSSVPRTDIFEMIGNWNAPL